MRLMGLLLVLSSAVLSGCVNAAALVEALAKDEATVCVNVGTVYGTLRIARTNISNGDVACTDGGLTVKSQATQVGLPITVVPQLSIGQPVVAPPPR